MPSFGMLRRVTLVRTDVSEELSFSIIRVTRIGELGTTLAVTSNRRTLKAQRASFASYGYVPRLPILVTLMIEVVCSSETSVFARSTRCNTTKAALFMVTAGKTSNLT
jgi:hypothetical protein